MIAGGIQMGVVGASAPWALKKLGAAFVLDPSLFTLSGSNVTAAADAGGGSVVLTSASGAEHIAEAGDYFGGPTTLRTSNASGKLQALTGGVTGASSWHIVTIARQKTGAGGPLNWATFAQFGLTGASQNAGIGATATKYKAFGNNYNGVDGPAIDTTWPHILETSYDGTSVRFYFDGKLEVTDAHTFNISDASLGFRNWFSQPTYPPLDVRAYSAAFAAGKVWSRADVLRFLRYEFARFGGLGRIVAFFGDSTTAGGATGTTAAHYFPVATRAASSGGNVLFVQNKGVTNERTDQILTRLNAYTDQATHIHWYAGVNDILQTTPGGNATTGTASGDAALIYANAIAAVQKIHSLGAKAIVATIQQWDHTTTPGTDANNVRIAYNNLIRANSAGADAIADIEAAFGPYDAANFCADHLHPNDTANDTLAGPTAYAAIVSA